MARYSEPRGNYEIREQEHDLRELLKQPEGFERFAREKMPEFIQVERDYEGFVRDVIMVTTVEPEDLVRVDGEVFVTYSLDIPGMAMALARNGEAPSQYIDVDTIKVSFHSLDTPRITINQHDLDTQPYDLMKRTQEKCGQEMAKLEDGAFLKIADELIAANPTQRVTQAEAAVSKAGLLSLKKIFSRNNVTFSTYLMNPATYDDLLLWGEDDLDDNTQKTVLQTGEIGTLWGGIKIVVGILIDEKRIYGLAPKDILGKMPILRDVTLDAQRVPETREREVMAYETLGLFVHSHKCVARLDLGAA